MSTIDQKKITVEVNIHATLEKTWEYFTLPEHIVNWNNASDEWHTPKAENDLRVGGKFSSRMEAKNGSSGFDFEGYYEEVKDLEVISYKLADGRKVTINFMDKGEFTVLKETFDPETTHSEEMQKDGWQSILNNFKKYVESIGQASN